MPLPEIPPSLDEVRWKLGRMAEWRLSAPFSEEDQTRYEELLSQERALLTEISGPSGDAALLAVPDR